MLRSPPRASRSGSESSTDAPVSPSRISRLSMTGVSNLFIRVRRFENRVQSGSQQQQQPQPQAKPGQVVVVSGEPKTHPCVERVVAPDQPGLPVEYAEGYVCAGGVNVVPLLVATRSALMKRVQALGADTLTHEQWECTITGPKPDRVYKVQIRYIAFATNSPARNPDRPVFLENAKGIPGLMTIIKRIEL